jgi:protein-tyrosine phosphatase
VIDLHVHLLPRVDDGAEALEDSVLMCRQAAADGCTLLVATPHRRRDPFPDLPWEELGRRLDEVREAVGEVPALALGAEVRVDSELVAELDAAGDSGDSGAGPPTLAGSRAILLELEPRGFGPDPVELVRELKARGLQPVVAHPELTTILRKRSELVADLVAAGALMQVTAMSVTGEFGRTPRAAAGELFDAGLAHFVASDAHRPYWRPPGLGFARRVVAERWGEPVAAATTLDNARALLAGEPVGGRPTRPTRPTVTP